MNSADQGVYPMDTAFKRRWDFKYIGIDEGESAVAEYEMLWGETGRTVSWNELRKKINAELLRIGVNEDKLLGPFFIAPSAFKDEKKFVEDRVFENKVLMYLHEDAAKLRRKELFENGARTYSEICDAYRMGGPNAVFKNISIAEI